MKRHLGSAVVFVSAALALAGCLCQETSHSLYLTPDGAATWSVQERDIRSDERDPWARWREEQEFLDRLGAGLHPKVTALRHLGGEDPRARLVRKTRPFAVVTEARFTAVDDLIRQLLAALRIPGEVTLTRDGPSTTLEVLLDQGTGAPDDEHPVVALVEETAVYRVLLVEGRFTAAAGLTLADDDTAAVLEPPAFAVAGDGGRVRLSLTWAAAAGGVAAGAEPHR